MPQIFFFICSVYFSLAYGQPISNWDSDKIVVKKSNNMSKQIWNIDGAHSEIGFKVRHMMITNVNGIFNSYSATMAADATDFSDAEISFEADIDSVSTRNEQRDGHLKSPEFFDAENRLSFIDIGHFESEQFTIELIHAKITEKFRTFAVHKTGVITNPVLYY
jgi:polyisoprenoid-binding protein YceI